MYGKRKYSFVILDLSARWKWSSSRSSRFVAGKEAPGTLWIGVWVGFRAGLDY
jgi:hypothetical protein